MEEIEGSQLGYPVKGPTGYGYSVPHAGGTAWVLRFWCVPRSGALEACTEGSCHNWVTLWYQLQGLASGYDTLKQTLCDTTGGRYRSWYAGKGPCEGCHCQVTLGKYLVEMDVHNWATLETR